MARRGWGRPLSGAGLVAAALLVYLGGSRWQAPSPRRESRPVARPLAVDLAPARPSAAGARRAPAKVSEGADLHGDEPGGASSAEREPTPREPGGLAALVKELAAGSRGADLTAQLPPLADPRYLRACTRELSN